jgi:PPOX class probable F420-dependent enzyme
VIPPAAEEFLRAHTRTFLLTVRADGRPACHPMVGLWHRGALYMNTYRKSAKARNIARDARVACVVVTGDDEPRFQGVVLRGRAEIMPPRLPSAEPAGPVGARPAGVGEDVTTLVQMRLAEGKRVVVRVVPDEVRLVGEHG